MEVWGGVSWRREGGECVGKGWGAWVWRALCLRQAARGACTCWEVASEDGGGGGALRRAAWGVGRRARRAGAGRPPSPSSTRRSGLLKWVTSEMCSADWDTPSTIYYSINNRREHVRGARRSSSHYTPQPSVSSLPLPCSATCMPPGTLRHTARITFLNDRFFHASSPLPVLVAWS